MKHDQGCSTRGADGPKSPEKERIPIQITLPDGSVKEGTSWETTPMSIAVGISKGLAEKTVVAKVRDFVKRALLVG